MRSNLQDRKLRLDVTDSMWSIDVASCVLGQCILCAFWTWITFAAVLCCYHNKKCKGHFLKNPDEVRSTNRHTGIILRVYTLSTSSKTQQAVHKNTPHPWQMTIKSTLHMKIEEGLTRWRWKNLRSTPLQL